MGNGWPSVLSHSTLSFFPTDDVHSTSILSPGLANDLDGTNVKNGIGAKV